VVHSAASIARDWNGVLVDSSGKISELQQRDEGLKGKYKSGLVMLFLEVFGDDY
jgi:hypothetical protein